MPVQGESSECGRRKDTAQGRIFRQRRNPRDLLPARPIDAPNVQFWWDIVAGFITEDDIAVRGTAYSLLPECAQLCDAEEHAVIDRLIERGPTLCGVLDKDIVRRASCAACGPFHQQSTGLFVKGLVYFNVPISDDDCIVVPPLENFVMNRVSGDFFERLLYKVACRGRSSLSNAR